MTTKSTGVVFESNGNVRKMTKKELFATRKSVFKRLRELIPNV